MLLTDHNHTRNNCSADRHATLAVQQSQSCSDDLLSLAVTIVNNHTRNIFVQQIDTLLWITWVIRIAKMWTESLTTAIALECWSLIRRCVNHIAVFAFYMGCEWMFAPSECVHKLFRINGVCGVTLLQLSFPLDIFASRLFWDSTSFRHGLQRITRLVIC